MLLFKIHGVCYWQATLAGRISVEGCQNIIIVIINVYILS